MVKSPRTYRKRPVLPRTDVHFSTKYSLIENFQASFFGYMTSPRIFLYGCMKEIYQKSTSEEHFNDLSSNFSKSGSVSKPVYVKISNGRDLRSALGNINSDGRRMNVSSKTFVTEKS